MPSMGRRVGDDHEDVICLYNVDSIDNTCLLAAIQDVFCMNLKLRHCHGPWYNGSSNMTESSSGAATEIKDEVGGAVLTHCYGCALILAVGDTVKKLNLCLQSLDVVLEISNLIRFLLRHNALFVCIKVENSAQDEGLSTWIWSPLSNKVDSLWWCHSELYRTTVPADIFGFKCLDTALKPAVKDRIVGINIH